MKTKIFVSQGFSLLEMVLALALVALTAAFVMTFFPKEKHLYLEDKEKIGATFIAERIINTLQATLPEGIVATAPDWIKNSDHRLLLPLDQSSVHYFAYDVQGRPRREVSATEYPLPLREEGITSLAKVAITPETPNLARISVTISTPATFPDAKREHSEFTFSLSRAN